MNRLPNVVIKAFGGEYDLGFGRSTSDRNWLIFINKQSGAGLPVTPFEPLPTSPREAYVFDVDGIHSLLKRAGIVDHGIPSEPSMGLKVRKCGIIHEELLDGLKKLEQSQEQHRQEESKRDSTPERGTHSGNPIPSESGASGNAKSAEKSVDVLGEMLNAMVREPALPREDDAIEPDHRRGR